MDKQKRLETLQGLLALANGNANKAEAMAAIGRFHVLLEKYGLTMEEIENVTVDDFDRTKPMYSGEKHYGFVDRYLWKTLADFCGVKVGVTTLANGDYAIEYFGLQAQVMEATALRATIRAAMKFEWELEWRFALEQKTPRGKTLKQTMEEFHYGIADECRERMEERKQEVMAVASQNALIVKTAAIVATEAKARGFVEATAGRGRGTAIDTGSGVYAAGREAGSRINFGTAVAGGGGKMIGKH